MLPRRAHPCVPSCGAHGRVRRAASTSRPGRCRRQGSRTHATRCRSPLPSSSRATDRPLPRQTAEASCGRPRTQAWRRRPARCRPASADRSSTYAAAKLSRGPSAAPSRHRRPPSCHARRRHHGRRRCRHSIRPRPPPTRQAAGITCRRRLGDTRRHHHADRRRRKAGSARRSSARLRQPRSFSNELPMRSCMRPRKVGAVGRRVGSMIESSSRRRGATASRQRRRCCCHHGW